MMSVGGLRAMVYAAVFGLVFWSALVAVWVLR